MNPATAHTVRKLKLIETKFADSRKSGHLALRAQMKTELEIIDFPLSDGTTAKITALAQQQLEHQFGVTNGRLKRGRGSDSVVVKTTLAFGRPVRDSKE